MSLLNNWRTLSVSFILLFLMLFHSTSQLEPANRPDEMRDLANMLRGKWNGKIDKLPGKRIEMQGNWILDGHFVQLQVVTSENDTIGFMEKFIFGWDASKQSYTCHYFNSSGITGYSLWTKKNNSTIVQVSKSAGSAGSISLQNGGAQLIFSFDNRKTVFSIVSR